MPTLTANTPVSLGHCVHKLPTSCRLTATSTCCACQDRRPHSSSYSKYIDGVGFVLRGTRQESYCWMCKEFWNARILAAGLRSSEAQIPSQPDQTEFLKEWYDWHHGRIIKDNDEASEERQELVGESPADTGFLPRSLEQARDGTSPRELLPRNSININLQNSITNTNQNTATHDISKVNLEDRIFDNPSPPPFTNPDTAPYTFVDTATPSSSSTSQATDKIQGSQAASRSRPVEHQTRHIISLRRELQCMRVGIERIISGLQDLGADPHAPEEATARTSDLNSRLGILEQRLINLGEGDAESDQHRGPLMDPHSLLPLGHSLNEFSSTAQTPTYSARHTPRFEDHELQSVRNDASAANTASATRTSSRSNPFRSNMGIRGARAGQPTQNTLHSNYSVRPAENIRVQELEQLIHHLNQLIHQYAGELQDASRGSSAALSRAMTQRDQVQRELNHLLAQPAQGNGYESPIAAIFSEEYTRDANDEGTRRVASYQYPEAQLGTSFTRNAQNLMMHRRSPGIPFLPHTVQTARDPRIDAPQTMMFPNLSRLPQYRARHSQDGGAPESSRSAPATRQAGQPEEFSENIRDGGAPGSSRPTPVTRQAGQREGSMLEDSRGMYRFMAENGGTHTMPGIYYGLNDEKKNQGAEERGLDADDGRPEPLKEEEMMVKLECKVCFSQIASVAVLPCGHCVMCKWCAEQTIPSRRADRNQPAAPANCPVCRKRVKSKATIFFC